MSPADRIRSFILSTTRTVRFVAPVALAAILSPAPRATVSPAPAASPDAAVVAAEANDELASVRRDVRLRKLHLVRPDLIQYPLSYDVFC